MDSKDGQAPGLCDYENSEYRTDFWEGQGREYEDAAERIALRKLLPPRGGRLLDIGAGFGRLADMYAGYEQVVLLDYSRSQLEYARSQLGDGRFIYVAADIYRLPLATNCVDTVVMVRVLHHMADVSAAFSQIHRALVAGGTYVLEFANKRHLKNVLRFLVGRSPNPFERQPYEFAELHFDFHPAWVLEQLVAAGFQPGKSLSVSMFRLPVLKRVVPAKALARLDGLFQGVSAPFKLAPSQFVRSSVSKVESGDVAGVDGLFRCPACGAEPLVAQADGLVCDTCGAEWPRENGVYLFK